MYVRQTPLIPATIITRGRRQKGCTYPTKTLEVPWVRISALIPENAACLSRPTVTSHYLRWLLITQVSFGCLRGDGEIGEYCRNNQSSYVVLSADLNKVLIFRGCVRVQIKSETGQEASWSWISLFAALNRHRANREMFSDFSGIENAPIDAQLPDGRWD